MTQNKTAFTRNDMDRILMVVLSAVIYSSGMQIFVRSGNLFPAGYAGISRLAAMTFTELTGIPLSFSIVYFTLNILTTMFVWKRVGHKFVLLSVLWFSLTSLFTQMFDLPVLTSDPLLISVFGGIVNGSAVGLALRANASSGGTDFIAIDLSSRLNRPTWNYIFGLNAAVLALAGLRYGWNQALYSIIFQYASKEVVNSLHQKYRMSSLHIVTDRPDEVSAAVFNTVRHGITKIACEGQYLHEKHSLLMITVNNDQIRILTDEIRAADPHCFITTSRIDRIVGNFYQKPLD